jgi:hypothetical protein
VGRRWDRAKADSHGWVFKREVAIAVVCGALAILAVVITGGPGVKLGSEIIVVASALLGVLLLPPLELAWNYLRAPRKLLETDVAGLVASIREVQSQLTEVREGLESKGSEESQRVRVVNVKLTAMNHVRHGKQILTRPSLGAWSAEAVEATNWTDKALRLLSKYVSAEAAEGLLAASSEVGYAALPEQIAYLEGLIDDLRTDFREKA